MNFKQNRQGFTIVELLIVIVVIGILAAITIVAYNGIQNRAKTNAGQQTASQAVKKIEAINAIKGTYFASSAAITGATVNTLANTAPTATEAVFDTPTSLIGATAAATGGLSTSNASNGNVVSGWGCATGANIYYLNYDTSANIVMKAGTGC